MNMFVETSICRSLEDVVFKWGNIMVLKIILTSSEGRGVVNAIGLLSETRLLSVSVGITKEEEEEEELVMSVYDSASLVGGSLRIAFIDNGLPAHLVDVGTFMKRPFCSLIALILPAGARLLLLLGAPSLPSSGGCVPSVVRRRRLVRVDVDGDWDARAAAASCAFVSNYVIRIH